MRCVRFATCASALAIEELSRGAEECEDRGNPRSGFRGTRWIDGVETGRQSMKELFQFGWRGVFTFVLTFALLAASEGWFSAGPWQQEQVQRKNQSLWGQSRLRVTR